MSTLKSYLTGYMLSVALTLLAFGMIALHVTLTAFMLTAVLIFLAIVQLCIQLFFFLHVGRGADRHWNAAALVFALFVVFMLVGGTLWIMSNLQANAVQGSTFINNQITPQNEND